MVIKKKIKIGILGQGYVGLPLAIEFGKKYYVKAYDINKKRIYNLNKRIDTNKDISKTDFKKSSNILFTTKLRDLTECNVFIITVPTPIKKNKKPELKFVKKACTDISSVIKKNDIVILESTVYPGLTEEFCVPIIEKNSKLKFNLDFFFGYSPERINPNDKKHTLTNIVKITSGSNKKTALFVDKLYKKIIKAGTYPAPSIRVAEAAKVIENTQRDLNIAFMNELCLIFDKMNINTSEVLKAASTKWNFINFKPGIVGGHCIGVDPYYLTYKSNKIGYNPTIITAGRKINDKFVNHIINKSLNSVNDKFKNKKVKILILGLTFKENCVDTRNSQSIKLVRKLMDKNIETHCYDPLIDLKNFTNKNSLKILKSINTIKSNYYHCCIVSVAHDDFKKLGEKKISNFLVKGGIIFDIKNIFPINNKYLYL